MAIDDDGIWYNAVKKIYDIYIYIYSKCFVYHNKS